MKNLFSCDLLVFVEKTKKVLLVFCGKKQTAVDILATLLTADLHFSSLSCLRVWRSVAAGRRWSWTLTACTRRVWQMLLSSSTCFWLTWAMRWHSLMWPSCWIEVSPCYFSLHSSPSSCTPFRAMSVLSIIFPPLCIRFPSPLPPFHTATLPPPPQLYCASSHFLTFCEFSPMPVHPLCPSPFPALMTPMTSWVMQAVSSFSGSPFPVLSHLLITFKSTAHQRQPLFSYLFFF